jgi:lipid-A-disaccharide synthase
MMEQRIFFSVGEPSGDLHGANLIRSLRTLAPSLQSVGFGGPQMANAGCKLDCDMTDLAVMGLWKVMANYGEFRRRLKQVRLALEQHQPRAVVLIDYPGFNWWVARHAKDLGIPVYYYGVPQMWGWAPWRVRKLRQLVDHVLCKLPFEPPWFQTHGVKATYVGHPYFDELYDRTLDRKFIAAMQQDGLPLVTLLPGSRDQEVRASLPVMVNAVREISKALPSVRFACASFRENQADLARVAFAESGLSVEIYVQRTKDLIESATCCIACSGSVSLELLYHQKPTVILYRIPPTAYLLQEMIRTARYFTLVNLLAAPSISRRPFEGISAEERDALPMPEFLLVRTKGNEIATLITSWLNDSAEYQRRVGILADLKDRFAAPGASQRAAQYIVESLGALSISPPSPHWSQRATIHNREVR